MKQRITAILAALMLTGCTNFSTSSGDSAEHLPTEEQTAETVTAEETTPESDNSEYLPAESAETSAGEETSEPQQADYEPLYYPAMPAADEAAMSDEALKAQVTDAVRETYFMYLLKEGACTVNDRYEEFFGEVCPDVIPSEESSYVKVKGVSGKTELLEMFRSVFTDKYLSELDPPLEEQLFGDCASYYSTEGETVPTPYFMEKDGILLAFSSYNGVAFKPDYDGLVITSAGDDSVCVSVAATCLSFDNWCIFDIVLKNEDGILKTDSMTQRYADFMGNTLALRLNEENLSTLGRICGNVQSTGEEHILENNGWYIPVDAFMSISEMREFLHSNFTDEAAKLYEPHLDNFLEKDGRLYYREGGFADTQVGNLAPNRKSFGSYELTNSQSKESVYSQNVEICSSLIPWNDGSGNTAVVTIVLENGKLACELPCTFAAELP